MPHAFPKRCIPSHHSLPTYNLSLLCPLCGKPLVIVWNQKRDGHYYAIPIIPGTWRYGQYFYRKGEHKRHFPCPFLQPQNRRYTDMASIEQQHPSWDKDDPLEDPTEGTDTETGRDDDD